VARLLLAAALLADPGTAFAQSVFTTRPDDPQAVHLTPEAFGVRGDDDADDSAGLQAAVDKAGSAVAGGIVLVPPGRYVITKTIYVWRAVRLVGYGPARPTLVLPAGTPGYQSGMGVMALFTSVRPGQRVPGGVASPPQGAVPPNDQIPDANQTTFYSGMSNIDMEIGDRNPAAVAVRFHVAQHGILSHMDFRTGSGLAAVYQIGNQADHLRFHGGRYGILTENTTPYWPFTLLDSVFDGQRDAAIREHLAGLTVIRTTFRNVPTAIEIDRDYSDQLWVKDSRFENVSRAAVVVSNERNALTQIGVENAVCANVPVFARFRESGRTEAGAGPAYRVTAFNHGLVVPASGGTGRLDTTYRTETLTALPPPPPPAIRPLPPTERWVNVHTLGVKGDGVTDDTDAIRKAIASHPVLYFPTGYYIVSDTITLGPDTAIIALHPGTTQLDLPDSTPGFAGMGPPRALLETPRGATNIVSGLGLYTGGINPRAVAALWMAGESSLMYDVRFHGPFVFFPPQVRDTHYKVAQPTAPGASGRWGAQYPSLWVTRGGGGTFASVWSPNTFARSGFYVSDTTTPGYVYELSSEHHLAHEIKLERVSNWEFHAPQTEEEAATSPDAVAIEIVDSTNITFNNVKAYRVTRSHAPHPAAVRIYGSSNIRFRNVRVNSEHGYGVCDENGCGTFLRAGKFPYDNAIQDVTRRVEVRERDFAVFDVAGERGGRDAAPPLAVLAAGAAVERLEGGFRAIAGAAVDAAGTLYFVDHGDHRIYSWSRERGLSIVGDAPLDPVNLAVARSGDLLIVSSAGRNGTVYSMRPGASPDAVTVVEPAPMAPAADAMFVLPVNVWVDGQFADQLDLTTYQFRTLPQMFAADVGTPKSRAFVSPDGSRVLPAGRVFRQPPAEHYPGIDTTGWRWSHNLDAFGLITARAGQRVYVVASAENRTYRALVGPDGTLRELTPFAERGGEGVAVDSKGHVYVLNGQIFVYDPSGRLLGRIDVPERPIGLAFGGADRQTLFILTRHALYAVKTRGEQ
jgi:sugar lactone lactonase YvrE